MEKVYIQITLVHKRETVYQAAIFPFSQDTIERSNDMIQQYYNNNAKDLYEKTIGIDLHEIYAIFESYLKMGDKILDVGFGSGRDSLYFNDKRYDVVSIDFAKEVVVRGKSLLNNEVLLVDVEDIRYENEFDGIWASAILLHYKEENILGILERCAIALKKEGVLYVSFKYGQGETTRKGRFFNDFTEEKFESLMKKQNTLVVDKVWKTEDARSSREGHFWLNAILKKR